jgi:hypothetical protein
MTVYAAKFSTGFSARSTKVKSGPSVHAWLAIGTLKSGKPWRMHGFSFSAEKALARLSENTRHLPRQGAKIILQEIVPATVVKGRVAA